MKKQMIKRADGSYSQRGLWDNIRANRGSGKKPTAQMLKQERKIKRNMAEGGDVGSAPANTFMSPGVGSDPRFEQYYNRQLQDLKSSGVTGVKDMPSRNDIYSYYQSAKPQSVTDQTGRMIFSNPKGTISSGTTFSQAVDPNTGMVLKQNTNLEKDAFDKQAQRFRSGGLNNPGFKALPGYVKAKIRANMQVGGMTGSPIVDMINNQSQMPMMQMGGNMPQTSAGRSVLQEAMAMSTMQSGGKMPAGIARARFMAAANGNVSKARETASEYGYKMQNGARVVDSQKAEYKQGGSIKDMYYMKNGGQFPERYKKMGFSGVDKPKRTTSGGKSHAVVTKVDGNYKLIRFGQAGEVGSPDGTARNKAFKARHAKNIAKGKSSAAYWANKVKW